MTNELEELFDTKPVLIFMVTPLKIRITLFDKKVKKYFFRGPLFMNPPTILNKPSA
jgi:hypothetical protein